MSSLALQNNRFAPSRRCAFFQTARAAPRTAPLLREFSTHRQEGQSSWFGFSINLFQGRRRRRDSSSSSSTTVNGRKSTRREEGGCLYVGRSHPRSPPWWWGFEGYEKTQTHAKSARCTYVSPGFNDEVVAQSVLRSSESTSTKR